MNKNRSIISGTLEKKVAIRPVQKSHSYNDLFSPNSGLTEHLQHNSTSKATAAHNKKVGTSDHPTDLSESLAPITVPGTGSKGSLLSETKREKDEMTKTQNEMKKKE